MKHLQLVVLFAGLVLAQNGQFIPNNVNIEPDTDLRTLPNNSLYLRWRPRYHVLAPGGHMNDPCGPMYDPTTKLYHIFYQSFPQHVGFGNTSWSHATSPDLISWTDVRGWQNRSMVAIATGSYPQYDWIGAFSGGAQAVNLHGEVDGNLTLMYTGASRFPDNWQLPYKAMTEQQAIATSSDGGQTWQKYAENPVLDTVPPGWNVTGFRDPIFQQFPELDLILGHEPNSHWYITVGSGLRYGVGSRVPLYQTPANDLTDWKFLGALFEPPGNFSFGGNQLITGNYGFNFELVGLFPLSEQKRYGGNPGTSHWVITVGAEGYASAGHPVQHWSLFIIGSMSRRDNGSAEYRVEASGVLDWVDAYAFNQFYDPVNDRRIVWGWNVEGIAYQNSAIALGYSGTLTLPREVYIMVKHNVVAPPGVNLEATAETWSANGDGTYTVKTLGQHPCPDVVDGIQGGNPGKSLDSFLLSDRTILPGLNSSSYHIRFSVPAIAQDGRLSIFLRATSDFAEYVNMTYLPSNDTIILDRSRSTLLKNITTGLYTAHFHPYTYSHHGRQRTEPLDFDIYIDGSTLEVFINDRFALTSQAYPSRADALYLAMEATGNLPSNNNGWSDWHSASGGRGAGGAGTTIHGVQVQDIKIWDKMLNVWPNRSLNASSPLEFDPYYETHLTFPNPYVDEGYPIYDGYKKIKRAWEP